MSAVLHAAVAAVLILAPLWANVPPPPPQRDYVRALLYDPPPPPPPPLPKGRGLVDRMARPAGRAVPHDAPVPRAPTESAPVPAQPSPDEVASDTGGSPTGSDQGVPEGMEGGQVGGVVGGVPGGVVGGVLGGTGSIPVPVTSFDRPPRLLRMVKPDYPSEAFVKKIQGVVTVEILIDAGGRVVRARVTRSVPELDAAALDAVRRWVFSPAVKSGQPVATLALAPVTFTLY